MTHLIILLITSFALLSICFFIFLKFNNTTFEKIQNSRIKSSSQLLKNPSNENIAQYLAYIDNKNKFYDHFKILMYMSTFGIYFLIAQWGYIKVSWPSGFLAASISIAINRAYLLYAWVNRLDKLGRKIGIINYYVLFIIAANAAGIILVLLSYILDTLSSIK